MTCLPDEEVRRGVRSYSGSLPRPRTSGARQVRVDDDDRDVQYDDHTLALCQDRGHQGPARISSWPSSHLVILDSASNVM